MRLKVWIGIIFLMISGSIYNCQTDKQYIVSSQPVQQETVKTNTFTLDELKKIDLKLRNWTILSEENNLLRKKITYQSNIIKYQDKALEYIKQNWYEEIWDKSKFWIGLFTGILIVKEANR